ncbi:hypothetical protein [Dyadobacter sandarakinus]|uniref:Uncharacterized protein n=1 Tax=Dyadobacter sandarakinus TaxID=2747268 RepID=A0ABX7IEE1_9BACT|nr:hypothetical protein [Dyadobacter sandarakinus]QRR03261.1 hypothetical protein HWI92_21255 [Dyadobacter sandarakinus]
MQTTPIKELHRFSAFRQDKNVNIRIAVRYVRFGSDNSIHQQTTMKKVQKELAADLAKAVETKLIEAGVQSAKASKAVKKTTKKLVKKVVKNQKKAARKEGKGQSEHASLENLSQHVTAERQDLSVN